MQSKKFSNFPPRAVGILIRDTHILLLHRMRNNEEFYCLPGGGVDPGESIHDALIREIKEETNFDVQSDRFLFSIENQGRIESYYLVERFSGKLDFIGPERIRADQNNVYEHVWMPVANFRTLGNFYPKAAQQKISDLI
jgi:8-oxo-dGTP diphosphatase